MASLEESQKQVSQARSKLAKQRKEIKEKKSKAQKQRDILEKARKKLPSRTSQRALRQTMGGIQGRTKRREVKKTEEKISSQKGKVKKFVEGLTGYEQELTKYEKEKLIPAEKKIKSAQLEKRAYERAESLIEKGMVGTYMAFIDPKDYSGERKKEAIKVRNILEDYKKKRKAGIISTFEELSKQKGSALTGDESRAVVKQFDLISQGKKSGGITLDIPSIGGRGQGRADPTKDYNLEVKDIKSNQLKVDRKQARIEPTFLERFGRSLSVIPSVSAKSLISSNVSQGYDINGDTGVSSGIDRGGSSSVWSRVSDSISNIIGGKEDFKEKKDKGRARINGNVVSAYDPTREVKSYSKPDKSFTQKLISTPALALASAREFSADVAAQSSAELGLGGGNVATYAFESPKTGQRVERQVKTFGIPAIKLERTKQYEAQLERIPTEINKIDKQIENLESNINLNNEWTGSEKNLNRYNKLISERERKYNKYTETQERQKTIQEDLGFWGRGISDFETRRPVASTVSLIGAGAGEVSSRYVSGGKALKDKVNYPELNLLNISPQKKAKTYGEIAKVGAETASWVGGGVALGGAYFGELGANILGEKISKGKVSTELKQEAIISGGLALFTAGVFKGGRYAAKKIPRARYAGLNKEKYYNFLEQAGKSARKVDDADIIWRAEESKPSGMVQLIGKQKAGGLTKVIRMEAKPSPTESGRFLISGVGQYETTGAVPFMTKKGLKTFGFAEEGVFTTGAKGIAKRRGIVDGIEISKSITLGKTTPIFSTRYAIGTGIKKSKAARQIRAQAEKNIIIGGETEKSLAVRDILKLNKDTTLTVGKSELGVTKTKQEKSVIIDLLKGGKIEVFKSGDKGSKIYSQKKTPLSKMFQVQEVKPRQDVIPTAPPKSQTAKVIAPTETKVSPAVYTSAWAGKGQYERTESALAKPSQLGEGTQLGLITSPQTATGKEIKINYDLGTTLSTKKESSLSPKFSIDSITKQQPKQFQGSDLKSFQGTKPKQRFKAKQVSDFIQSQRMAQGQQSKNIFEQAQKTTPETPKPTPKRQTPFKKMIKKMSKEKGIGDIEVFARKGGVDISIGKTKTKEKAAELLKGKLKGTLRASGFAKVGGKKTFLDLGEGFRRSRADRFRVVEKKTRRIKTSRQSSEAKEIQFFRKQKKGNKKKTAWGV